MARDVVLLEARIKDGDTSLEIEDYKFLLAEYAKDSSKNAQSEAIIDILVRKATEADFHDKFYTVFTGTDGNFNDYPVLAALYYGNTELFEMLMKIPNISLGESISAKHKNINVGIVPPNAAGSHEILMQLYEKLTPDEIVSAGLFNLAVFFGDEELVNKFLSPTSKVDFAMVANLEGARLTYPINYCAALCNSDPKYKRIFEKLLENKDVISGLSVNKGLVLQLLLEGNFDAVIAIKDKGYVLDTAKNNAISPLVTGLSKIPVDAVVDIGKISKVCSYVIESEQKDNVEMFAENVDVVQNQAVLSVLQEAINKKIPPAVSEQQEQDGLFRRLSAGLKKAFTHEKNDGMSGTTLSSSSYHNPLRAVITSSVPLALSGRESPNLSEQFANDLHSDLVAISKNSVDMDDAIKGVLAMQLTNRIFADMAPGVAISHDVNAKVCSEVLTALKNPHEADETMAKAINIAMKHVDKSVSIR